MKNKHSKGKNEAIPCQFCSKFCWISLLLTGTFSASLVLTIPQIGYTLPKIIYTYSSKKVLAQRPNSSTSNESQIKNIVLGKLQADSGSAVIPQVRRVIIVDDYAIADWLLGESGGSAVLAKKNREWDFLDPGGGVYSAEELQQYFRIPKNTANKLIQLRIHCIKFPDRCDGAN